MEIPHSRHQHLYGRYKAIGLQLECHEYLFQPATQRYRLIYFLVVLFFVFNMFHPLDPLSPAEHRKASQILRNYHAPVPVRFKAIDLLEAPKQDLLAYLQDGKFELQPPPRKAYSYYHRNDDGTLRKATINLATETIESDTEHPESQGPADIDEIDRIYNLCNAHPAIQEEIKKLKLPDGYATPSPHLEELVS